MVPFQFDVAVFDEAHHTAGKGKDANMFAYGLRDPDVQETGSKTGSTKRMLAGRGVPIRRRIFMTATPKTFGKSGSKVKDGERCASSVNILKNERETIWLTRFFIWCLY